MPHPAPLTQHSVEATGLASRKGTRAFDKAPHLFGSRVHKPLVQPPVRPKSGPHRGGRPQSPRPATSSASVDPQKLTSIFGKLLPDE